MKQLKASQQAGSQDSPASFHPNLLGPMASPEVGFWPQLLLGIAADTTPSHAADTLPNPPLGSARYYLVASERASDRRLARQYVGGAFSARVVRRVEPGDLCP